MTWYRLTNPTGEVQIVGSLDGYDPAVWTAVEIPAPTEQDVATTALTLQQTEAWALDQVEARAEAFAMSSVMRVRREIAILNLWREIQALKLAQAVNQVPTDATERGKRWPMLMALVQLTGNGLAAVSTAAENRLSDRVKRIAVLEAKMMLARDAIRAATTKQDKIAALNAVDWAA
jgi:hypothetical protein